MNFDSLFGERLKEERERLGLSQAKAGSAAGVSREMWGKYERGAMPGADVLIALASSGADVLYILTGTRSAAAQPVTPDEQALLGYYRLMEDQTRASYKSIGNALAQQKSDKKAG